MEPELGTPEASWWYILKTPAILGLIKGLKSSHTHLMKTIKKKTGNESQTQAMFVWKIILLYYIQFKYVK